MKRHLVVLLLIVVLASGCISGESDTATNNSKTATTTLMPLKELRNYSKEELLQNLETITFVRFRTETTGIATTIIGEANQTVSIKNVKVGYVDITNRRAEVNSTAAMGPSTLKSRIVVTNESAYIEAMGRKENLTDPEVIEGLFESINPVSIVKRALVELEPIKTDFINGTQEFYYNLTNTLALSEMPEAGRDGNATIKGTAVLRFRGGFPVEVVFRYTLTTVSEQGGVEITTIITGTERTEIQEIKTNEV
ncbi:hypothetical protein TEU_04145 [Thermococcus eurythermalis]|uniref:Uncharacterized protein n=1 Tax=Thermococcus eurythermalis TaxID=1505907 RepID=A0A097QSZ4_9EURY|nr:hypothetical protein [Thermococcus eurythermalis]AIU69597.1 hypothetical protein TEU_04145 [Thermococcus eurythermalis]